jgi:hypothetical protein
MVVAGFSAFTTAATLPMLLPPSMLLIMAMAMCVYVIGSEE